MAKKKQARKKKRVVARKVIGILDSALPTSRADEMRAFYRGLRKSGVDGSEAMILYCWANNDDNLLEPLAAELYAKADVIVAAGGPSSALAAKKAQQQHRPPLKPIVFTTIADPRLSELVLDIYNPEGAITGTFGYTTESDGGRMQAIDELLTFNSRRGGLGALINPDRPYPKNRNPAKQESDLKAKAPAGRPVVSVQHAKNERQIDRAFGIFERQFAGDQIAGLLVTADPVLSSYHEHIIDHANRIKLPTIYQWPDLVRAGGLMSFGPRKTDGYLNAGEYAGRLVIDPTNIPEVRRTEEFEPVIRQDVATALDLEIPQHILQKPVKIILSG
jgi:putative ABC transport system substrate-binding protein